MYLSTYDYTMEAPCYFTDARDELIEQEMYKIKNQAMKKIASIVIGANETIAKLLAYSYFDSLPEAESLARDLGLEKLDFLAIQEDFETFKEAYLKFHEYAGF
jgi:hypothetical protein